MGVDSLMTTLANGRIVSVVLSHEKNSKLLSQCRLKFENIAHIYEFTQ